MKIQKTHVQMPRSGKSDRKKGVDKKQAATAQRVDGVESVEEVDRFEVAQNGQKPPEEEQEELMGDALEEFLDAPALMASVKWPIMLGMERLEVGLQSSIAGLLALTDKE